MQISHNSPSGPSSDRFIRILLDWARRIFQLSALAAVVLFGYLLYGLILGDVGNWSSMGHADRVRIAGNIQSAIMYLNIALSVLILTACALYYDDEVVGYLMLGGAVALFYGVPFLFQFLMSDQIHLWEQSNNTAALAIYNEFHIAALIMGVPGILLTLRDILLRILMGVTIRQEQRKNMKYGGAVKVEKPPSGALIGVFAKCWQLPYCRSSFRVHCPIYLERTKCWRERVGCMCEETVIRKSMDAIIHREEIIKIDDEDEKSPKESTPVIQESAPKGGQRHVRIPHNPNLPMSLKIERCRNCVIYNEHQRLKYQLLAPIFTVMPLLLTIWKFNDFMTVLNTFMRSIDNAMSHLALVQNPHQTTIAQSLISSDTIAEYLIVACVVIFITTLWLRLLEYCIFKLMI